MALGTARIESLTRELVVLDAQRRGIVAELKRLVGRRVNAGSVTGRVIAYLERFGGPATTTEILDFIIAERPRLKRRACSATLYRAARRRQIVRQGPGWVLPDAAAGPRGEDRPSAGDAEDAAASRDEGDA